jgi:hypothetical protein
MSERASQPKRVALRAAERLICRRASVVGAVSRAEGEYASTVLRAGNVTVIPNGIPELDQERTGTGPARPRRVVAGGRMVPQRRPEACARILAAVRDLAEVAWIGGAGDERGSSGWLALGARDIPVSGWISPERFSAELRRATVYLHWTNWDGLALSLLRAVAADAVIVASDTAPNREVVGPEQLCESEPDAVSLIRRIVTDDDYAEALLRDQRQRSRAFGAARMVADWLSLYERLDSHGRSEDYPALVRADARGSGDAH